MEKRNFKIALICTEMLPVPPIRGGAVQILISGVLPFLVKECEVTVYSISDPDLADHEITDRAEFVRLPAENYAYHVGGKLASIRKQKKQYDLIHVFNRPSDLLIYKSAMPNSRFVVSLHNEMYHDKKISEEMGNLSIQATDRIMSISNYIGNTIVSRFPQARDKVRTVYSGIDLKQFVPIWSEKAQAVRRKLRLNYGVEDNKVILFVGRLSKVKGTDVLIQSMKRIFNEHPDAVLMIVGSKWFHNEKIDSYGLRIRKLAESFGERIKFTGFVPPSNLSAIYLLGDIFVCSSQWQEPLARVHYEAMGAGLPVITTNRGGNAEIIRHEENGLVIDDYKNPESFADAIIYLLNNSKEALRIAKAGRTMVKRQHGFEHVANRLKQLYFEAMIPKNKK